MKKWSALVLLAVFLFFAIPDIVRAVGYFAAKPQQLLYVLGISVAGGLAFCLSFYLFGRLSPRTKQKLKVLGLGGTAVCSTGLAVGVGYLFICYLSFPLPVSVGTVLTMATGVLFFAFLAGFLWVEFVHLLKT